MSEQPPPASAASMAQGSNNAPPVGGPSAAPPAAALASRAAIPGSHLVPPVVWRTLTLADFFARVMHEDDPMALLLAHFEDGAALGLFLANAKAKELRAFLALADPPLWKERGRANLNAVSCIGLVSELFNHRFALQQSSLAQRAGSSSSRPSHRQQESKSRSQTDSDDDDAEEETDDDEGYASPPGRDERKSTRPPPQESPSKRARKTPQQAKADKQKQLEDDTRRRAKDKSRSKSSAAEAKESKSVRRSILKPSAAVGSASKLKRAGSDSERSDSDLDESVLAAIAKTPAVKRASKQEKKNKSAKKRKSSARTSKRSKGKQHRARPSSDEDSPSDPSSIDSSAASSSSTSSSGSDFESSDSETDYRADLRALAPKAKKSKRAHRDAAYLRQFKGGRPMAKEFIRNVLTEGKSILSVFRDRTWSKPRNEREALALSRIIDALRKGKYEEACELAVRRLAGVDNADRSGNWRMCDEYEGVLDKKSFVPDEVLVGALKNVMRLQAMEKQAMPTPASQSHYTSLASSARPSRPPMSSRAQGQRDTAGGNSAAASSGASSSAKKKFSSSGERGYGSKKQ